MVIRFESAYERADYRRGSFFFNSPYVGNFKIRRNSTLPASKRELLPKATDDTYRRAVILAENSHGRVGALISAQQGVIQITERHSTDTSGFGVYDTATIEKTAQACHAGICHRAG